VAKSKVALQSTSYEHDASAWAVLETRLGDALLKLGERSSGTEQIADAVTAYRAALRVFTKDSDLLKWIEVQDDLCEALLLLGMHKSGKESFEEAIALYRNILSDDRFKRDSSASLWGRTQAGFGNVLLQRGLIDNADLIAQAVEAFRQSILVADRDRDTLSWAKAQGNLSNGLLELGWVEN
jgi:tetratricopeptide (TPR) repeat protein